MIIDIINVGGNMKVLLYTENFESVKNSGLGRAIEHQMTALTNENIEYTNSLTERTKIAQNKLRLDTVEDFVKTINYMKLDVIQLLFHLLYHNNVLHS